MPYLVLARKYRPRRFEDVIGQEAIAQTLTHAITTGRVAHAYLFAGQRGVGKTTMARILASALNCEKGPTPEPCGACASCVAIARGDDLDVLEIDGASNTGVDNIRDLRSNARYAPARSRSKIYYVDEVHMLSKSAFNALLKTLEEPPEHVKFIFSTTEPHRIPETIHSRCQRFDFRSIAPKAVAAQLGRILEAEGLTADEAVLATLARRSRGSLRDALSLLDQLISATGAAADLGALERLLGLADREQVEAMGRAVAERDPATAFQVIERLVEDGRSLGEFLNSFIEHLRAALLMAACGDETAGALGSGSADAASADLAAALGTNTLLYAMQLCAETQRRLARAADERLPVEMAMVKLCTTEPIVPLSDLVARLERLGGGGASSAGSGPAPAGRGPARGGRSPGRGRSGPAPGGRERPSSDGSAEPGGSVQAAVAEGPTSTDDRPRLTGNAKWDVVVEHIASQRRRVGALLRHGTILSLNEDTLVLGFAPEHRAFIKQLSDATVTSLIEAQAAKAFERRIRLQFAVQDSTIQAVEAVRADTPTDEASALRERALADPIVRSAVDLFGARLVRARSAPRGRPAFDEPAID